MTFSEKYKPAVSKRTLLFIAGSIWLTGGGILIARALITLISIGHMLSLELISGVVLGACFYIVLFTKISKKHITRISLIKADFPCFFSFFNFRSYVMMIIMISVGIALRQSHFIDPEYLYTFYLIMGIPLLFSAIRFFVAGIKNTIQV
jgi:hypothetical protein